MTQPAGYGAASGDKRSERVWDLRLRGLELHAERQDAPRASSGGRSLERRLDSWPWVWDPQSRGDWSTAATLLLRGPRNFPASIRAWVSSFLDNRGATPPRTRGGYEGTALGGQ